MTISSHRQKSYIMFLFNDLSLQAWAVANRAGHARKVVTTAGTGPTMIFLVPLDSRKVAVMEGLAGSWIPGLFRTRANSAN